jgi:2-polyprenyl-6-methoxyphenol hydroxylase-like FAD-dependent oxidoreductase
MPVHARAVDIAVVGAGLAGSLAAAVLGRKGYRIALIDRYQEYPPEFRVEKIGPDQIDLLRRLGMLEPIAAISTPFSMIANARHGRIVDRTYNLHYGIFYQDLVNVVRRHLPSTVHFIAAEATGILPSAMSQNIVLSTGHSIRAKVVVLATGMAPKLRQQLGIVRKTAFEKHSISFGFNIATSHPGGFEYPALTYYGDKPADGIDYLSVFPIGKIMRGNLFTFRDPRDPWIRDLRRQPTATLADALPGLRSFLGDFHIDGKVHNWTMDLHVMENYLQDGIVLIGDAFQTSCPAAGTGVSRLLWDVHVLCEHLPRWLASEGTGQSKLAQFYNDPVKQQSDRRSLRLAQYRRSLTVEDSLNWRAHRQQAFLRRRMFGWARTLRFVRNVAPAARAATKAQATPH